MSAQISQHNAHLTLYHAPQPARILIVEDDPQIQRMVTRQLRATSHELTMARDGHQALRYLDQQDFDLVLLDVMLPGMDGFDVCRQIRTRYAPLALPVLILSALGDDHHTRQLGLDAGANDFLAKPYSVQVLHTNIERLLAHKALHSRIRQRAASQLLRPSADDTPQTAEEVGAAILVIDLAEFAPNLGKSPTSDSSAMLEAYLQELLDTLEDYGGAALDINHHQLLVGFNILHEVADPMHHALKTALAVQQLSAAHIAQMPDDGDLYQVRMGVHQGAVNIIPSTAGRALSYVAGPTVEMAYQMAGLAALGHIALSASAYAAVTKQVRGLPIERLFGVPLPLGGATQTVYQVQPD